MNDITRRVIESLDGTDPELLPYIPYLLQDLREIGADPAVILSLIKDHIPAKELRILDLGCGKGAVSVQLAANLACRVVGIDYIQEFVEDAKQFALESGVNDRCTFLQGDGRELITGFSELDIVVLGAVGTLLGNIYQTLRILKMALKPEGYVIMDDAYLDPQYSGSYNRCCTKEQFYRQIKAAGFEVVAEDIFDRTTMEDTDRDMFENIKSRADELSAELPHKRKLFEDYVKTQEYEFRMLATSLITGTWLLQKME